MKNKITNIKKRISAAFDSFIDPYTSRGSVDDRTERLIGNRIFKTNQNNYSMYEVDGILQNIIESPADDSVRNWFTITTNKDGENLKIGDFIQERLNELKAQNLVRDLIKYSRINNNGAFLYFGILSNTPQIDLSEPIDQEIDKIDFINLVQDSDKISLINTNKTDITIKNFNEIDFYFLGRKIHPSRLIWLVNNFDYNKMMGISIVETVSDAIKAMDSTLWSIHSLMQMLRFFIIKSEYLLGLTPEKIAEVLEKFRYIIDTQSGMAMSPDESFEMHHTQFQGLDPLFTFLYDNLGGKAKMPKNILLGKSHGVVTAGEYDTINHYANISKYQENILDPVVLRPIIDLIIRERSGKIFQYKNGLTYKIEFNSLWQLDPLSESDKNLKDSQRDINDINSGKITPDEARELDPRYKDLDPLDDIDITKKENEISE